MALSFNELVGLSQASSGDYRHGLGTGQEALEPGGSAKYAMTTKPNTTVVSKVHGRAPVARRVSVTKLIEELEFLTGTPGIHPRVLAQKAWQARQALTGSSKWAWANYQDPFASYGSHGDLVARLQTVERLLGIDKVSPKLMSAMSGGLGSIPEWGQALDPYEQLARCVRAAICAPSSFCCPPGTVYEPDEFFYEDYPPEVFPTVTGTASPPPSPKERTWGEPPKVEPKPKIHIPSPPGGKVEPPPPINIPSPIGSVTRPRGPIRIPSPEWTKAKPKPAISVGGGAVQKTTPVSKPSPVPGSWEWHHQRTNYDAIKRAAGARSGGAVVGAPSAAAISLSGLGAASGRRSYVSPGLAALMRKIQECKATARRR